MHTGPMPATDIIDYDEGGCIYLVDEPLRDQMHTLPSHPARLRAGIGALCIDAGRDRSYGNLARVSVEVGEGGFPPEPESAEFLAEAAYLTEHGSQRLASCYFEECQGELAGTLTPAGPARVHVRLYELPGPHQPYLATAPGHEPRLVPVDPHLLIHLWNEPLTDIGPVILSRAIDHRGDVLSIDIGAPTEDPASGEWLCRYRIENTTTGSSTGADALAAIYTALAAIDADLARAAESGTAYTVFGQADHGLPTLPGAS